MKRRRRAITWLRQIIPKAVPDIAALAGAALLVRGVFLIYAPAGWIAAGVALITAAMLLERAVQNDTR